MINNNFVPRKFKGEFKEFDKLIHDYNIFIILGETGSGKTYLFKNYHERHLESSRYIELIALDYEELIDKTTEVVLLDSIDEALYYNPSDKVLKKKLSNYILKCREINENIKFVIACRYSEWKKDIYSEEFKKIDKDYKTFEFDSFKVEYINFLLDKRKFYKNKDSGLTISDIYNPLEKEIVYELFWKFCRKHYLLNNDNQLIIKNIQVILFLIDNFMDYENQQLKYYEIYQKLIEEHLLSQTSNERSRQLENISIKEMLTISSILAYYLTYSDGYLGKDIDRLASLIYLKTGFEILPKKLKYVLDTALYIDNGFFDDKRKYASFSTYMIASNLEIFNKSYIKDKDIGEEVLVHFVSLDIENFQKWVDKNPFLFRQHPNLTLNQQKQLLISILNKLQKNSNYSRFRREDFNNIFFRLDKLSYRQRKVIVSENMKVEKINNTLYFYLLILFNDNLTDFFSELWKEMKNKKGEEKFNSIVQANFFENMDYNYTNMLFEFMKKNNLFEKQENSISNEKSFCYKLFTLLYANNISLTNFIFLMNFIPTKDLTYIIEILTKKELLLWLNSIDEDYEARKYSIDYITYIIYGLLKKDNNFEVLEKITFFVIKHKIIFKNDNSPNEFLRNSLKTSEDFIKVSYFWEVYFHLNVNEFEYTNILFKFFYITQDEVLKLPEIYNVGKYKDHYIFLKEKRMSLKWDFLLEYKVFEKEKKLTNLKEKNIEDPTKRVEELQNAAKAYFKNINLYTTKTFESEFVLGDVISNKDNFINSCKENFNLLCKELQTYSESFEKVKSFLENDNNLDNLLIYLEILIILDVDKGIELCMKHYLEIRNKELYKLLLKTIDRHKFHKIKQVHLKELIIDFYEKFDEDNDLKLFRMSPNQVPHIHTHLWDYVNDEGLLRELMSSGNDKINDLATEKLETLQKTTFEELLEKYENLDKPLIITEGKTDWKHLEKALQRFKKRGLYKGLDIKFDKYIESRGWQFLLDMVTKFSTIKLKPTFIFIFDRDEEKPLRKYGDLTQVENNIYAFCIPSIEDNGVELQNICIEFYYGKEQLKLLHENGRRLFIGEEFEKEKEGDRYYTKGDKEFYIRTKKNITLNELSIIDGSDKNKKVFRTSDNKSMTITKNEFADNMIHNLDIENFKKIFDIIEKIVKD